MAKNENEGSGSSPLSKAVNIVINIVIKVFFAAPAALAAIANFFKRIWKKISGRKKQAETAGEKDDTSDKNQPSKKEESENVENKDKFPEPVKNNDTSDKNETNEEPPYPGTIKEEAKDTTLLGSITESAAKLFSIVTSGVLKEPEKPEELKKEEPPLELTGDINISNSDAPVTKKETIFSAKKEDPLVINQETTFPTQTKPNTDEKDDDEKDDEMLDYDPDFEKHNKGVKDVIDGVKGVGSYLYNKLSAPFSKKSSSSKNEKDAKDDDDPILNLTEESKKQNRVLRFLGGFSRENKTSPMSNNPSKSSSKGNSPNPLKK